LQRAELVERQQQRLEHVRLDLHQFHAQDLLQQADHDHQQQQRDGAQGRALGVVDGDGRGGHGAPG
jgi:hypothetical protein